MNGIVCLFPATPRIRQMALSKDIDRQHESRRHTYCTDWLQLVSPIRPAGMAIIFHGCAFWLHAELRTTAFGCPDAHRPHLSSKLWSGPGFPKYFPAFVRTPGSSIASYGRRSCISGHTTCFFRLPRVPPVEAQISHFSIPCIRGLC